MSEATQPSSAAPAAVAPQAGPRTKPENLWLNLLFNAVVPAVVLSYGSNEKYFGPVWGMLVALAFPLGYALYDLIRRRKWNVLSVVGFTGTLLTGSLGLLKMSGFWFAVKEAAVPLVLGLAIPATMRTRQPLVRTLLYNDQLLDTGRIRRALEERRNLVAFEHLLWWASWVLAAAFLLSAMINFGLAWWLLPAESGTEEFNRQLGKLQFWSWPGVVVPSSAMVFFAMFRLVKGLEQLTGLKGDDLFHPRPTKAQPGNDPRR
jgi:hypothetical protein